MSKDEMVNKTTKYTECLLLIIISTLFLLVFSINTSPLYDVMGKDSDTFMMLGKFSAKQLTPYKDFFDHKGPFIVLIEWLGYKLNGVFFGVPYGVFIIQVFTLSVTLVGVRKICSLYYESNVKCVTLSMISLLFLNMYYEKGNLTEEYCLPFLMWSTYFAINYFVNSDKVKHKNIYSFLYGITFMVGAFTRLTNAIPICVLIVMIAVKLIRQKEWKSLVDNGMAFVGGAFIFAMPYVLYFVNKGALQDMLYATFIYNFRYSLSEFLPGANSAEIIRVLIYLIPLFVAVIIGVMNLSINKKCVAKISTAQINDDNNSTSNLLLIISGVVAVFMQISSAGYMHYLMVWIPVIMVALCTIAKMIDKEKITKYIGVVFAVIIITVAGVKNISVVASLPDMCNLSALEEFREDALDIQSFIPKEERNDVIAYNVASRFYLETDILPDFRYCILQDWQSSRDKEMFDEVKDYFQKAQAQYIVIKNGSANVLDKVIEQNYTEVKKNSRFVLLKKK